MFVDILHLQSLILNPNMAFVTWIQGKIRQHRIQNNNKNSLYKQIHLGYNIYVILWCLFDGLARLVDLGRIASKRGYGGEIWRGAKTRSRMVGLMLESKNFRWAYTKVKTLRKRGLCLLFNFTMQFHKIILIPQNNSTVILI